MSKNSPEFFSQLPDLVESVATATLNSPFHFQAE